MGNADLHVEKTEARFPLDFFLHIYNSQTLKFIYTSQGAFLFFLLHSVFLRIILYR